MTERSGVWLWLGITSQSFSAPLWLGLIIVVATEPEGAIEAILGAVVVTAPLIGFGIHCLARSIVEPSASPLLYSNIGYFVSGNIGFLSGNYTPHRLGSRAERLNLHRS